VSFFFSFFLGQAVRRRSFIPGSLFSWFVFFPLAVSRSTLRMSGFFFPLSAVTVSSLRDPPQSCSKLFFSFFRFVRRPGWPGKGSRGISPSSFPLERSQAWPSQALRAVFFFFSRPRFHSPLSLRAKVPFLSSVSLRNGSPPFSPRWRPKARSSFLTLFVLPVTAGCRTGVNAYPFPLSRPPGSPPPLIASN